MRKYLVAMMLVLVSAMIPIAFHSTTAYAAQTTASVSSSSSSSANSTQSASFTAPTTETGTITGKSIFETTGKSPTVPVISNYGFDANGFLGNFDPVYWLANILFSATVAQMFLSMEFFSIGYSANGLNDITNISLKILHSAFQHVVIPLIPLVVLSIIGVFVWFGVVKKDLPSVFGRFLKTGMVFLLVIVLSSPSVANAGLIQKIGDFPGEIGNFFGGVIESVVAGATGQQAEGTTSLINDAWIDLVVNEWVTGEEGQNYSQDGSKVVSLLAYSKSDMSKSSAWRYMLGYPLNNSERNQVAKTLENTPNGQTAFSSSNRFITAGMAFFGNLGPVIYFFVMGAVMIFARLAFLILVAAGAIILPLELFPVTRSTVMTLRWIQYMAMSLFTIFFVSVYTSVLLGLNQILGAAFSGGIFGSGISAGFAEGIDGLSFLGQGLSYIVAIVIAWVLYRKMRPMQRIKKFTEDHATGRSGSSGSRRLAGEARRTSPWEKRNVTRKSMNSSGGGEPARNTAMFDRVADAAREGVASARSNMAQEGEGFARRSEFEAERANESIRSSAEHAGNPWAASGAHQDGESFGLVRSGDDDSQRNQTQAAGTDSFIDVRGTVVDRTVENPSPPATKTREDTLSVIDRWERRANQLKGFVSSVDIKSPDTVMDTMMGATLGFAANKISKTGGKIATGTVKRAMERYESRKIQRSMRDLERSSHHEHQVRPQFNRDQRWAVVDVEVITPPDRTSRYTDWLSRQKAVRDGVNENGVVSRPKSPKLIQRPVKVNRYIDAEPLMALPAASSGEYQKKIRRATRLKPANTLTRTTVSKIRLAQSNARNKQGKRLNPSTGIRLPKEDTPQRPNLRRKGPGMADKLFGDRH